MAMRLTGLMSGMDTESIIQELVAAKRTKVDDAKKAQKRLSWKQDAWKSLSARLKTLQTKYLNNMRFSDTYSKKTTKVSNSNAVSVITGESAMNGVQTLSVDKLAKTGYLTGGKITSASGDKLTALSKMSELTGGLGTGESSTINVACGDKSVDINITGDTTISDVLTQMKTAGINANFDANQQRFYVVSNESGKENDFSITASDANGDRALSALGLKVNLNQDVATLAKYKEYGNYYVNGDRAATLANMRGMIDDSVASRVDSYLNSYKNAVNSRKEAQGKIDKIQEKYADTTLLSADEYASQVEAKKNEITELKNSMRDITDPDQMREAEERLMELESEANQLDTKRLDAEILATNSETVATLDQQITDIQQYVDITAETDADGNVTYSAAATSTLIGEVEDSYYNKASYAHDVISNYDSSDDTSTGATKVSGQDAVITLNGAEYTNSTNVFEINGLTFTALDETNGEEVTITTQDDTEGIFNMVKDFLKEYNSIVNEMDKLYNADPAKGYEPLTDEEKEGMSESEIEEWETKIKDSLLRRDSNLSTISSALKQMMSSGVEVNGKKMYLSDFGINTLGYFESADNEKNAYHIDGDEDDEFTSTKENKLLNMITSDPDTVISFFSGLSKNLYSKMTDLSRSSNGYRSYGSFYDDKKMKEDYDDYTTKIADLEKKLNEYEDKWYAKFAAMETAMAKMQKSASAVTSLLGGS